MSSQSSITHPIDFRNSIRVEEWERPEEQDSEARIRAIVREEVRRGGFTKLPNWIIENGSLSPAEFRLLAYITSFEWGPDPYCHEAQPDIAEKLGLSERTVRDALKKLEGAEWIKAESPGAWTREVRGQTETGQTKRYHTNFL